MEEKELPNFNSKSMSCIVCDEKMFYSPENLVHVCLREDHGILAFFEPENCWFAASENTNIRLEKAGVKHHLVPKQVFENGGIGANLECEYNEKKDA